MDMAVSFFASMRRPSLRNVDRVALAGIVLRFPRPRESREALIAHPEPE